MDVQDFFEQPLDNRYRLEELIADKKYLVSYVAYDIEKEQTVAIDFLKAEQIADKDFITDYTERMNVLAHLPHPNLPTVLALGTLPDATPYTVREYVAGYPLTERLEQLAKQGLPVYSIYALRVVRQVAEALVKLEQARLFHYALAPENILLKTFTVKSDDAVVVLDAGIPSHRTATFRVNGHVDVGSHAAYLPPEQVNHDLLDGRSHVYSLGVILYELLTGQVPERVEGSWEPLVRQAIRGRTSLEKVRDDLTRETYALVDRCLRREAWQRFPTIEAFVEALDKAIMAEDVRIRTAADVVFVPRRNQRPFILLIISIIALLLAGGTLLLRTVASDTPLPPTVAAVLSPTATEMVRAIVPAATATAVNSTPTTASTHTATPPATVTSEPATPTPSPSSTATIAPTQQPRVRVIFSSVSVRSGPGTHYDIIDFMPEGETAVILGRSDTQEIWYNIQRDTGTTGWVANSVIALEDGREPGTIPTAVTIPPSPTPTLTPTATPTVPLATPTPETGDEGGGGTPPKPKPSSTPPPLPTSTGG